MNESAGNANNVGEYESTSGIREDERGEHVREDERVQEEDEGA